MTRWVIHSRTAFDAVHALTSYHGAPETPHSHRWQVAIRVGTDSLNVDGYALDFHEVHAQLAEAVAQLADSDLNRHPEIGQPSPSAERMAEVLARRLERRMAALGGRLLSVSVWEGPDNRVDLELDSGQ
jgi:6-pyruvoyl-tetrahydropterin synthase